MSYSDSVPAEAFQLAAEMCPIATAFANPQDQFVWVNNSWVRMLGYSPSELEGKTWLEFTSSSDIGPDQQEKSDIDGGKKLFYHCTKEYLHKIDRRRVLVEIFVCKFPQVLMEPTQGYIVFAVDHSIPYKDALENVLSELNHMQELMTKTIQKRMKDERELEEVKTSLQSISEQLCKMDERWCQVFVRLEASDKRIEENIAHTNRSVEENREVIHAIIQGNYKGTSVNVTGDYTGGDKTGRDKNSTQVIKWLVGGLAITLCLLAVTFFGTKLAIEMTKENITITTDPGPPSTTQVEVEE